MIDGQNRVGRFGGSRGAPRSHGDPDVGQGQRGGIVNAVAGHDDRPAALLAAHHIELVRRGQPGQHLIHAGQGADRVGGLGPVAGGQDDAGNAAAADGPDRLPGIGGILSSRISAQGGLAVGRDEHGQRAVQAGRACGDSARLVGSPRHPAQLARPTRNRPGLATVPVMPWPGYSVTAWAGPAGSRARPPRGRWPLPGRDPTPGPGTRPSWPSSSGGSAQAGAASVTVGWQAVSVPVLSSTSVVHRARRSSTPPPFTTTPRRAAADSPETRATA